MTANYLRALWLVLFCTILASSEILAQEPITAISAIQQERRQDDDSAYVGQTVTVEGVVTGVYGSLFFVQEASGDPWNGLAVYAPDHSVAPGDEIRITGPVTEYYDLTEIEDPERVEVLHSGKPLPDPVRLPVADVADERWEGMLVQVTDVTVTAAPDEHGEWMVADESGSIRVDDKGVFYSAQEGEAIAAITAIVDHAFGSYRLIPRSLDDIGDAAEATVSPPEELTPVYAIQGTGAVTPLEGERVDVVGVVTAVGNAGFFLQDPIGDGDPQTSDGVYVYSGERPEVEPGDCVFVRQGLVSEYYAKTELSRTERIIPMDVCPARTVDPVAAPLAALNSDPVDAMEPFEGMLVSLADFEGVVQGPTKRFSNGDVEIGVISQEFVPYLPGGRVYQSEPGDVSALLFLSNIVGSDLPEAAWGDLVTVAADADDPALAVVDYNFGKYQLALLPGQDVSVTPRRAVRDAVVPAADDEFSVCTFNVFGLGRGSDQHPHEEQYAAEVRKRATAIAEGLAGCTIIGLQETGTPEDAATLTTVLAQEHDLEYTAVAIAGPNSTSAEFPLTNSLLARSDRVTIVMSESVQGCSRRDYGVPAEEGMCPPRQYALFNRPPLVVDLLVQGEWEEPYPLTVIVNHFKSKGGDESVNVVRRRRQAEHVAELAQARLDDDPEAHVVVLGDLNDFYASGPIETLGEATAPDLLHTYDWLPPLDRYTYIFNGASQVLDHILITPGMAPEFAGVDPIHFNADFPAPEETDPTDIYHASDHDPVQLVMRPEGAGWIGGTVLVPGVIVALFTGEGASVASSISDAQGEFRFWGLTPGDYTVVFIAPDPVTVAPARHNLTVEAGAGLYLQPAIDHGGARIGSAAVVLGAALTVFTDP